MFKITVHGTTYEMLADTGATESTLRSATEAFHLSQKIKTCIGVSGTPIKCKVTKLCPVECEEFGVSKIQHSFVIVPECPVNLAGRDLLCALGLTIECTEKGLVLKKSDHCDETLAVMVCHSPAVEYCWSIDPSSVAQELHDFVKTHSDEMFFRQDLCSYKCVSHVTYEGVDEQFKEEWNRQIQEERLHGNGIVVTEDFVVLLVDLNEMQRKVFRKIGVPYVVLASSPALSDYDVGMVLQGMDVSCCDTKLATGQKVNCEKGVILHPFHCTFSAHRTIQLADQFPLVVHNFVMDSFESKENHPALEGVPKQLWATHKYDVGLIKDATPLVVVPKSDYRPNKRQYPLRPDAEEGMTPIIEQLLNDKIIVPAPTSPCNTPLLPIKKADGKSWRPVHDLRAVNEAVFARAAVVPNPATILSSVPGNAKWFTVIDLANAFFSIPVDLASQYWFAFTFKGKKYTWTRVPQGFAESPTVYSAALQENLAGFVFPKGSTLIQYVDDLLVCSISEENCIADTNALLKYLALQGHKASLEKLQLVKQEVHYLGHEISQNKRTIGKDRIQAVLSMPKPMTKKQVLSFLGCTGYCRQWICDYAKIVQPLSDMAHATGLTAHDLVTWTPEATNSFVKLKEALASAPALGIPDLSRDFTLAVDEKKGFYSAVLLQKHGDKLKPVAYYSQRLPSVVRGLPPCSRAVAAAAAAVTASSSLVAYRSLTVLVPHAVATILLQAKTAHFTPASTLHYYNILSLPHVTLQRCNVLNPATLLPIEEDGEAHDCLAVIAETVTPRQDLSVEPLLNPDLIYYVDGSARRLEGIGAVGYAIVTDHEVVESARLPAHLSAQAAELFALTRACILASGKSVTIYTDSRYAFGVVHDFGTLWKNRGFLTSQGTPIQHHQLVGNLLEAILLPSQIAVCKCQAHVRIGDAVSKGNSLADSAAKSAAVSSEMHSLQMYLAFPAAQTPFDPHMSLKDIQSMASAAEKTAWRKHGRCDSKGVWRGPQDKPCLPKQLFPYMAKLSHGPDHVSKGGMTEFIAQNWDSIGFSTVAENFCKRCLVCAQHNIGESSSSIASEGRRNNPSFPARRLGFGEGSEETTLAFSAVERSIPGPAYYTNGSKSQGEDNLDPCVPL
ncbi:uncharacterized protein LOC121887791 [Thunnus maccoyii]|uniref:uncharacterized protein LOC121887791 n=1 Tax=Thunnus maccoyii TaxID=8240 RepID=UPI001C4D22B7|nr:uncharacterized protein LOC121887791 [Thunnus maccoyii]